MVIGIYQKPDINDLLGIARVVRSTQIKIPYTYDKPVKPFDFKIIDGGVLKFKKLINDIMLPELLNEEIQEYELKCIYCQLFINKYLRSK